MRIAPLFLLVAALAFSPACKDDKPAPPTDQITEALAKPEVVILDVRTPDEYAAGHVEGAINLPVADIAEFPASYPQKDRQIVVHCAVGGRSAQATTRLTEMGYTNILDAKTPDAVAKAQGKELVK